MAEKHHIFLYFKKNQDKYEETKKKNLATKNILIDKRRHGS